MCFSCSLCGGGFGGFSSSPGVNSRAAGRRVGHDSANGEPDQTVRRADGGRSVNLWRCKKGRFTPSSGRMGREYVFNILTGEIPPTQGEVFFQEKKITGRSPSNRPHRDSPVFSTEQSLQKPDRAGKREAGGAYSPGGAFSLPPGFPSFPLPIRQAERILEEIEIMDLADRKAGELSHGAQRAMEVALALAAYLALILLDEPTSGMSPEETIKMIRLVKKLAKQRTMIVIEHNMNLVWSISTTITVLHQGQVIATGSPKEIGDTRRSGKPTWGGIPGDRAGQRPFLLRNQPYPAGDRPLRPEGRGRNPPGAEWRGGKTTTLKTIMGLVSLRQGRIHYRGENISGLKPYQVARRGIAVPGRKGHLFVPDGRRELKNCPGSQRKEPPREMERGKNFQ